MAEQTGVDVSTGAADSDSGLAGDFHRAMHQVLSTRHARPHSAVRIENPPRVRLAIDDVVDARTGDDGATTLVVAHAGLLAASSPLPGRVVSGLGDANGDVTAFLNLLTNRLLHLDHDAWHATRLVAQWERRELTGTGEVRDVRESLTQNVKLPGTDRAQWSPLAGYFLRGVRTAEQLSAMLGEFLQAPVLVREFIPVSMELTRDEQQIVQTDAVCDRESRLRIEVGPLSWDQFRSLIPGGAGLASVLELSRLYAGRDYDFEIELTVRKDSLPAMRVGSGLPLRWASWFTGGPSLFVHAFLDADVCCDVENHREPAPCKDFVHE